MAYDAKRARHLAAGTKDPGLTTMTAQLTSITHTAPSTPDYALQNLVQNTGFGFVTANEGNTLLSVVKNLQVRVAELETELSKAGIVV